MVALFVGYFLIITALLVGRSSTAGDEEQQHHPGHHHGFWMLWPGSLARCALPSFCDKLPAESAARIEAIWADYNGTLDGDCAQEKEQMWAVLDALPVSVKEKLFVVIGAHRGFRRVPSYLLNVTAPVRAQFLAILRNRTLEKADKFAAVEALVAKQSPEVQKAYKTWKEKHEKRVAEFKLKLANLTKEARAAYDHIRSIKDNKTLTREEKREQIWTYEATLSEEVCKELRELWSGFKKHGYRGWGRGGHGGVDWGNGDGDGDDDKKVPATVDDDDVGDFSDDTFE